MRTMLPSDSRELRQLACSTSDTTIALLLTDSEYPLAVRKAAVMNPCLDDAAIVRLASISEDTILNGIAARPTLSSEVMATVAVRCGWLTALLLTRRADFSTSAAEVLVRRFPSEVVQHVALSLSTEPLTLLAFAAWWDGQPDNPAAKNPTLQQWIAENGWTGTPFSWAAAANIRE